MDGKLCGRFVSLVIIVALFSLSSSVYSTDVQVALPAIEMFVVNCDVQSLCSEIPTLEIQDLSPDAASHFLRLQVNDQPEFDCEASSCRLELTQLTPDTGSWLTVWIMDNGGETIAVRDAFFRLELVAREPALYYFDFHALDPIPDGSFGKEAGQDSLSQVELANLSGSVLDSNVALEDLWTAYKLHGLCQELIFQGQVKPESCHGYGFVDGKTVNHCALEACREASTREQNRANFSIYQASRLYGIPPMILKNLILAESQFTTNPVRDGEHGLGHLTYMGVDTLLRWSEPFYRAACAKAFPRLPERCEDDYFQLDDSYKILLRSVILQSVREDEGVSLTAAILSACMTQVNFLVESVTWREPAEIVSFPTLWKIAVATYHGGAECTRVALSRTVKLKYALDWENIRTSYVGKCRSASVYVDIIFRPKYENY